jgi:methyl-accepting chemotaxis protein
MTGETTRTTNLDGGSRPHGGARIGLSVRIALPLLLPVLGLLALSGVLLAQKLATVTAMGHVSALSDLVTDSSALVHELQRERGAAGVFVGSKGTDLVQELTAQRGRTDARLAAFDARLPLIDADRSVAGVGALAGKLSAARDAVAKLAGMRRQISELTIPADDSSAYFTATIARLLDMVAEAAAAVEAPEVARSVSVYLNFLQAKELAGQERATGAPGFAAGRFDAARLRRLTALRDNQDLYFRILASTATPGQTEFLRATLVGEAVAAVTKMRGVAAEHGLEGHLDGFTGVDWYKATTVRIDLLKTVEDHMANDLISLASRIQGAAQTGFYETLAAVVALLGLTAVAGTMMIRAIVRPLGNHIRIMQRLAAGETDLVISHADRRDELGSMAKAIEVFRDEAIENQRLAATRERERVQADAEKVAALQGMADTIETETTKALTHVSERTATMEATADTMSASAARIGHSAESASAAASQALSNAQTVASAAEELSASIREISGQVSQSTAVVGRAVAAGDETRATIKQLDSKVTQIGTVADMIREIASRTNLLALNATIEAARAGEAGKGFAVVASEVKALAMQTARSTEEITRHLAEVKAATEASVAAVGRIGETVTEIDAIATSIAAAVEQQGAATAEIARNVAQTAQAVDEMTSRISEVSVEAGENGRQAGQVHDGASALAAAVSELRRTVVRVVRTSTSDVDRRLSHRQEVSVHGRVTVPGQGPLTGQVIELSDGGARIEGLPRLSTGTRGMLQVDGAGTSLPFTVRNQYDDGLGLIFDRDDATVAAIDRARRQMVSRQAA